MALIQCPECGHTVSEYAERCPNCAYPIKAIEANHTVRIKLPNNVVQGWVGLFSSRDASVSEKNGRPLWAGKHGENAKFSIERPTEITINMGGWANPVSGYVEPGKKYALVQDMGAHMFATYRLTEVDIIDSE